MMKSQTLKNSVQGRQLHGAWGARAPGGTSKWPLSASRSALPDTTTQLRSFCSCAWSHRSSFIASRGSRPGQALSKVPHRRDLVLCGSMASMVQDPADVIPNPDDSDDDEDDRIPPSETPVLVVGAGAVGIITAMYLARRGYNVQVVDKQVHPANRPDTGDVPLVLSSRVLMAFEELKATELLAKVASVNLKGRWHMAGSNQPTLEPYPGHDQRYTRRVLAGRQQLELALLEEAERLFPGKISIFYEWEFLRIDWDNRRVMVECHSNAGAAQSSDTQAADPLLPELAGSQTDAMWVPFGLLVGADGPDSRVREQLSKRKPKITDFDVQRPLQDTRQAKTFSGIPLAAGCTSVFPDMSRHEPRTYEYSYAAPGAPSIRLWISDSTSTLQGMIEGLIDSWDAASLNQQLVQAYGDKLPAAWRDAIVNQTCGADAPGPITWPQNVQCSQFHGPRVALVGAAAHQMTNAYDQGFNCSVEGIRLLNLSLKSTKDNLDRALTVYSEVRCEDAHSMQQLEFFKRSSEPGIKYSDKVFWLASCVGALVWRSALLMMSILRSFMPARWPTTYITDTLWDARKGYNDLLKVVVRFAAGPLALILLIVLGGLRLAMDLKAA